ncbi:MAG: hypothetical protein ACK55Z_01370, partial [bacterium]
RAVACSSSISHVASSPLRPARRCGPWRSRAPTTWVTQAPAISIRTTSVPRCTPPLAARSTGWRPCSRAIQRSGRRRSWGVESNRLGRSSSSSMSMSGC